MRKINFGILLTLLIVICVSVHCIVVDKTNEKDKESIMKFINEYIEVTNKYLPLEGVDIDKGIDDESYNRQVQNMRDNISKYLDESSSENILNMYEEVLEEQKNGRYVIKKKERKLSRVYDYKVFKDYISICIFVKIDSEEIVRMKEVIDSKTKRYVGQSVERTETREPLEYICVKKLGNGNYKIMCDFGSFGASYYNFDADSYIF